MRKKQVVAVRAEPAAGELKSPEDATDYLRGKYGNGNLRLTLKIEDLPLKRGRHTISIHVILKDMGAVKFSVTDQVN